MPRYDAYLLRVWHGEPGDNDHWAGRLEHLPDGQYQRFRSLEALLTHLRSVLGYDPAPFAAEARAGGADRGDPKGGS